MTDMAASAESKGRAGWALIGLGFLFLLALGLRTIAVGDVWGHLAAGRWIAEHGIPRADVFSFTAEGRPWVVDTWLYDRILFALWGLGPAAVIILHTLAVVAAYTLLLPAARTYAGPAGVAGALLVCGWLTAPVFTVGPTIAILIFPAIMIFLLHRRRPAALAWGGVLAAQLLWANMHLSFLLGPIICLAFAYDAGRRARYEEEEEEEADPRVPCYGRKQLLFLAAAALAVTFVNPFVTQLHAHAFATWADPTTRMFRTWISPFSGEFASPMARHMITLGLAVGALGLLTYRDRLPGGLTAIAIAGAALAVTRATQPQQFALLAFPFLALSVDSGGGWLLREVEKRAPRYLEVLPPVGSALVGLLILVSTAGVGTGAYYRASGSASAPGLGVNTDLFPEDAAAIIEDRAFPERALNLVQDGGYLAWRYPDRKVFVDRRARVYGGPFYGQLLAALAGDDRAWDAIEAAYAPEAFILNCTWPAAGFTLLDLTNRRGWLLAYFDGTTAVLLKNRAQLLALATHSSIQAEGLARLEAARKAYRNRLKDASGAGAPPRIIGAGNALFHLGRFKEAAVAYELLVCGVPGMGEAWTRLGVARLERGDTEEAVRVLESACDLEEKSPRNWLWLSRAYFAAGNKDAADRAYKKAEHLDAQAAEAFGPPSGPGANTP